MAKTYQWYLEHPNAYKKPGPPVYIDCNNCGKVFTIGRSKLRAKIKKKYKNLFCSKQCVYNFYKTYILVNGKKKYKFKCSFCKKEFLTSNLNKAKPNHFCSQDCKNKFFISSEELNEMLNHVIKVGFDNIKHELLKKLESHVISNNLNKDLD